MKSEAEVRAALEGYLSSEGLADKAIHWLTAVYKVYRQEDVTEDMLAAAHDWQNEQRKNEWDTFRG